MKRSDRRGIALVLVAGILMLLAGIAAAMVALASGMRAQASTVADRIAARLLARSGVEYGTSRLSQDSSPSTPPTPANQSDDWTYRDGLGGPLEISLNPSYACTEPYTDLQGNGKYDPGAEPYRDLNGNGRLDAWSGRLRCRSSAQGATFILKIGPEGGKISVNGGFLGSPLYNRVGKKMSSTVDGPPFLKSYDLPENGRVAELIDTLWEVLSRSPADGILTPRPETGEQIVRDRPLGGYRSLEEVRLRTGIPADQWRAMSSYLTVESGGTVQAVLHRHYVHGLNGGEAGVPESNPYNLAMYTRYAPYAENGIDPGWASLHPSERRRPVPLSTADPLLLQVLFRYIAAPLVNIRSRPVNGLPAVAATISPVDAELMADYLLKERPFRSRYDLYRKLDENKGALFVSAPEQQAEAAAMAAYYSLTPNVLQIRNMMVDLAFTNANPDDMEVRVEGQLDNYCGCGHITGCRRVPPSSWVTYDIERQADPAGPSRVERAINKPHVWKALSLASGSWWISSTNRCPFGTLELSLEPESAFGVESLGRIEGNAKRSMARGLCSALVQVGRSFAARGQDEFENAGTGRSWNLPAGVVLAGLPDKRLTQTYPMFPLDSCPDLRESVDPEVRKRYGIGSPFCGDVRLMHQAWGESYGAAFYVPVWEEGQPLRNPKHPEAWMENFRDIVGRADADPSPVENFLESGISLTAGPAVPGSVPFQGRYSWNRETNAQALNEGDFPMAGANGAVDSGTLELWSGEQTVKQTNPLRAALAVSDLIQWDQVPRSSAVPNPIIAVGVPEAVQTELMTAPGFFNQPDWHHVAVALSAAAGSAVLYVDGVPRARGSYEDYPLNPGALQAWESSYPGAGLQSGIRLYRRELNGTEVSIHAGQGRFWNPACPGGNGEVPSFTSPLYRFDRLVKLTRAQWEGFMPELARKAVDENGGPAPLRVELLCYDKPGPATGEEPRWVVPLPDEFWRMGGGGADFEAIWKKAYPGQGAPRIPALRYRVWMDVSAVNGFNNETPVFDSIEIRYGGAKLSQWIGE